MKGMYSLLVVVGSLAFYSCNEARRGSYSNLTETRNEAAAEENTDKFAGKKQRDAEFVNEVVASDYAEIKLAELATQKSTTPEILQIADTLLKHHAIALNELKTLAQAQAIAVPVEEMDASMRKIENLAEESEEDFNEEWCQEMRDMHEKEIRNFEDRLEDTGNAMLKAFINKMLPILKRHHENLKATCEKLKEKNS